jgi:hypothetical protein
MCIANEDSDSCEVVEHCSIVKMLLLPPEQRNLANKCEILKLGRPTTLIQKLTLANYKNDDVSKLFQKYKWMTACPTLNKIFCWPCLFFDNFDNISPWSNGIDDLSKLEIYGLNIHSRSPGHKNAAKQSIKFGNHVNQESTTEYLGSTPSTRDIQNNSSQSSTSTVNIGNDFPAIMQHDASKEVLPIPVGSSCNINVPEENTRNYYIKQSTNCHSSICDTLSNIQKLLQMEPTKYTYINNGTTNITITQEKYDIFLLGRPMPKLKQTVTGEDIYFKNSFYNRADWLSGCSTTNKLYCWPCLFFNTGTTGTVSVLNEKGDSGFRSSADVYSILRGHCRYANHLKAVEMYNEFFHVHGFSKRHYLLKYPSDVLKTSSIAYVSMILLLNLKNIFFSFSFGFGKI